MDQLYFIPSLIFDVVFYFCQGGYVILDHSLPLLRHIIPPSTLSDSSPADQTPPPIQHLSSTHLAHICGIIRGALTNLGFPCHVIAECPNPPTCT